MAIVVLLAALAACISVLSVVYATTRYLRVRHDYYLVNGYRATLLFAVALVLGVHPVAVIVDHGIGVPNLARWIEDSLFAVAGYFADSVTVAMARGAPALRQRRWMLLWLLVTICAMGYLLFVGAHRPEELSDFALTHINWALVAYRAIWLSFLTVVIIHLIVYNRFFARITPDPIIALTAHAMVLAGWFALGIIVTALIDPSLTITSPLVAPLRIVLGLCTVGMAASFIASTLPTWHPRLGGPALARLFVAYRTYHHIQPLWQILTAAVPSVVLPLAVRWPQTLFHASEMDFLLRRRVTECFDAWRQLAGLLAAIETQLPVDGQPQDRDAALIGGSDQHTLPAAVRLDARSEPLGDRAAHVSLGMHVVTEAHRSAARQVLIKPAAERDARRLREMLRELTQRKQDAEAQNVAATGNAAVPANWLSFRPETYAEEERYLELVAAALRRIGHERMRPHPSSS